MPTYEYECKRCESRFEVVGDMAGPRLVKVPRELAPCGNKCNSPCHRVLSAPNVNIKQGQTEIVKKATGYEKKHWDGSQDAVVQPKEIKIVPKVNPKVSDQE